MFDTLPAPAACNHTTAANTAENLIGGSLLDLLVFGEDWGRHPSSTQHLMRHIGETKRVVWVNSLGMRRPRFSAADAGRAVAKLRSALANPRTAIADKRKQPENLSVIAPLALPWPGSSVANRINRALVARRIQPHLVERNISSPILWTSLPTALPMLGAFNERAVIYYCGDDFAALEGVDHEPVARMEAELAERADIIFAASPQLAVKFPAHKTIHLPHGTDVETFSAPQPCPADLPRTTNRPVAGFYGSLSSWIDIELLAATATILSNWRFVLIGHERTDTSPLRSCDNVTFLGPRPHQDLPAYVQNWDVSLLPFRNCAQIEACNPLKLREYMAGGTPIASTPFPALVPFFDLIHTGNCPTTFANAIEAAYRDKARNGLRHHAVKDQSWQSRAATVEQAIHAHLAHAGTPTSS